VDVHFLLIVTLSGMCKCGTTMTLQPLFLQRKNIWYTAFGMWWHTVTHGRGIEGETGEWSE